MIAPIVAGVAALYGWYRYKKYQENQNLQTLVTAQAPPPGYASAPVSSTPTVKQANQLLKAISSMQKPPSAVPSDRIPSSAYGATGPAPAPAPQAGINVTGSTGFTFKI